MSPDLAALIPLIVVATIIALIGYAVHLFNKRQRRLDIERYRREEAERKRIETERRKREGIRRRADTDTVVAQSAWLTKYTASADWVDGVSRELRPSDTVLEFYRDDYYTDRGFAIERDGMIVAEQINVRIHIERW